MERVERHAGRLQRDAARLRLPLPERVAIESLFFETAHETFGAGDGIVRIEWSKRPGGEPELISTTRALGPDPDRYCARTSKLTHPGAEHRHNTKFVQVEIYDLARDEAREAGIDEVLLFDGDGLLVEGGASNFIVVTEDGQVVTPATELGCVEGLGLGVVLDSRPEIEGEAITRDDLASARELMACNGVRGVVPIIELDGRPVADGRPGVWARKLRPIFFREV